MKETIAKLMLLLVGIMLVVLGSTIFLSVMVSLYEMLRQFFEKFSLVILG